jgi:hypothetical protein
LVVSGVVEEMFGVRNFGVRDSVADRLAEQLDREARGR